jgi:hypothetical protein
MQISEILLFSRDGEPREPIKLAPGKLNVITGESSTGKSALVGIIDFCLGRKTCDIPIGVVRRHVGWFGLRLQCVGSEVLIIRRNPHPDNKTSSEVYMEEAASPQVPDQMPEPNTNTDSLEEFLNERLGIELNVFTPPAGATRHNLEANIRHALLLLLQEQDEIASKRQLFHRQSEDFMPQAIKDTLPYFLGTITVEYVAKRQALRDLQRKLRQLERRERDTVKIELEQSEAANALLAQARDVGLTPDIPEGLTAEALMHLLKQAAERRLPEADPALTEGSAFAAVDKRRGVLSRDHRRLQEQMALAQRVKREQFEYIEELGEQRVRLSAVGLMPSDDHADACVVCGSTDVQTETTLNALRESLSHLEQQVTVAASSEKRLDGLEASVGEKLRGVEQELAETRSQLDALAKSHERMQQFRDLNNRRAMVQGRITQLLELIADPDTEPGEALALQIATLRQRTDALAEELSYETIVAKTASVLAAMGTKLKEIAQRLELEHTENTVRIDYSLRTVVADTEDGPAMLSEMGSGKNWVGYHIAAHLALMDWFIRKDRPVPRFMFFDQPTQVYFPPDPAISDRRLDDLGDEDRIAVERMFRVMDEFTKSHDGNVQIIVADHADIGQDWFQNAVVERWRGGTKLVPMHWIDAGRTGS